MVYNLFVSLSINIVFTCYDIEYIYIYNLCIRLFEYL